MVLLIGVDMDAEIGKAGNNKVYLRISPNRKGEYQDFLLENCRVYLNNESKLE